MATKQTGRVSKVAKKKTATKKKTTVKRDTRPKSGSKKPRGEGNRGGRPKGVKNKITREVKTKIEQLLNGTKSDVKKWLTQVAKDDPGKAVDLWLKLAEFVVPKQGRVISFNSDDESDEVTEVSVTVKY